MSNIEEPQQHQSLQPFLKTMLEESLSLARKRIKTKKGITNLQNLLTDYKEERQLIEIIRNVIKYISIYQTKKQQQENDQEAITQEQYDSLEIALQKSQSALREHIRVINDFIKNQNQIKIYCDELQQKNQQLQKSNHELLKSTKLMMTNLKKQQQKLIQTNQQLTTKLKTRENDNKTPILYKDKLFLENLKKPKKQLDSSNSRSETERMKSISSRVKERKNSISSSGRPK